MSVQFPPAQSIVQVSAVQSSVQPPPVGHDMKHDFDVVHVCLQLPPAHVSEHVEPGSHV